MQTHPYYRQYLKRTAPFVIAFLCSTGAFAGTQVVPKVQPATQTICTNTAAGVLSLANLPTGQYFYQWYFKAGRASAPVNTPFQDNFAGWTAIGGATSSSYQPTVLTQDRTFACSYARTIAGATIPQWTDGACVVQIQTNPIGYGTIRDQNIAMTIPANPAPIGFAVVPFPGTDFRYQWHERDGIHISPTGRSTADWRPIAGATTATYDPPAGLQFSRTYACFVSFGTADCGNRWATGCVQIKTPISFGHIPGTSTTFFCKTNAGFTISLDQLPQGDHQFTYRWVKADGLNLSALPNDRTGWVDLPGQIGFGASTYTISSLTESFTVACFITPSNGIGNWATKNNSSNLTRLLVQKSFFLGDLGRVNISIPENSDPNPINFTELPTGNILFGFKWHQADGLQPAPTGNGPVAGWLPIQNATSNTYDPPAGLKTTRSFACFVTPFFSAVGQNQNNPELCGQAGWAAGVVQVDIIRPPTINYGTLTNGNQTLRTPADAAPISFAIAPTGSKIFAYQWYSQFGVINAPTGTSLAGWTAENNATSPTFDPPAGRTSTRTYACFVTPNNAPGQWATGARLVVVTP